MADVQLLDFRNRGNRPEIHGRESVARVHGEPERRSARRCGTQRVQRFACSRAVGVLARVQLDRVCAELTRQSNGIDIGRYEEAGANSGAAQFPDRPPDSLRITGHIQSAFSGNFFAPLGNERGLARLGGLGDRDHLIGAGEFEIEHPRDGRVESRDVGVLDMTSVLAQMCGDTIRAGGLANSGGLHRVGLVAASGLPDGGDVVHVHIKSLVPCSHIWPEYNFLTMKKLLLSIIVVGSLACHTAPPSTSGVDMSPGARTSVAAVERFFSAVHAQDLQAMSLVWGTTRGSARDNMNRQEMEKREVILQCYFNYDSFRVLGESPTSEIRHMVRVELVRGGRTRTPVVYTVMGPNGRWFVENLDISAVKDFCGMAPANPGGL